MKIIQKYGWFASGFVILAAAVVATLLITRGETPEDRNVLTRSEANEPPQPSKDLAGDIEIEDNESLVSAEPPKSSARTFVPKPTHASGFYNPKQNGEASKELKKP